MDDKDLTQYEEVVDEIEDADKPFEIVYDTAKDFYKGIRGELRFKAEGLFKKAKEKGISIETIEINTLKEEHIDFPGLGMISLPAYVVKVKGMLLENQQTMVDGKQIDFYNRYLKYAAGRIEEKNLVRDEKGRVIFTNKKPVIKQEPELSLSDWEKFEVGKALVEDKEFGLEKTITGACDRVIRKLMGENDWLYPGEARLLEEEFNEVDRKVSAREMDKAADTGYKKASDKQISYFKSKVRNAGLDPEDRNIVTTIIEQAGFGNKSPEQLSMPEMSRLIDAAGGIIPVVKEMVNN